MSEKKTPAFKGTKEQENELLKVIEKYKDTEGALIPVLQKAPAQQQGKKGFIIRGRDADGFLSAFDRNGALYRHKRKPLSLYYPLCAKKTLFNGLNI